MCYNFSNKRYWCCGFTVLELLTTLSVISILGFLVVALLSGSKEKSRRIYCSNGLRQFVIASQIYATDNQDRLLLGADNNGISTAVETTLKQSSHTINMAEATMEAIRPIIGMTNLLFCPGFSFGWIEPYSKKYGYTIGYNYLGGHVFETSRFSGYEPWTSPLRITDDANLALIADPNHKAKIDGWTIAPHGKRGPILQDRSSFVKTGGADPKMIGGNGGNVGFLDGSIQWRPIGILKPHIASSHGEQYLGYW